MGQLVTSTPTIAGGRIFFGAFDGRAYALSLADGSELWRYETHAPIPRDAVVSGANVLFGSRTYELLALDQATGRLAWSHYFWFSWIDSPPVLRGGTAYVGSSDSLSVRAIDPQTGHARWISAVPGWSWAQPAVGADAVYAGVVGGRRYIAPRAAGLAAFDRATGALRWLFQPPSTSDRDPFGFASAPVIDGRRLFAVDLDGTVYAFDAL